MYTQSQKREVTTGKQKRSSKSTAMTVVPKAKENNHHEMVAEAAYYTAERRGFAPGFELEDWLAAEHEVEKALPRKN
jgi:hypothetical protein